jgi:aryl-alcohol dehydrogenase-like predicted oxidoreductase
MARALATSDRYGLERFATMQNHYNLVYREEEREMIPLCSSEGIGCLPWSPLARGLLAGSRKALTDRSATKRAESDEYTGELYDHESDWSVIQANESIAKGRGVQPAEVALAWLLSKPAVVSPIIGATKLEHLDAAVRAVELTLSADEVKALEAPYEPHAVKGH